MVVGATPAQMVKLGYKPVGKDFPVFLHPETREEYALARTERKTARGYHGFEFHAAPEVTLEQDLARRDLTINAIAKDAAGEIIDPFGGAADLKARVLRHVGPAFVEDPVRLLRIARFAARFDFSIAPETLQLMRKMVADGEADALVAERVWQELARGLMERRPSRMFRVLADCGALAAVLPELAGLIAGTAGAHTLATLDAAAARGSELAVRFALLVMHAETAAVSALCERLRAPQECRELALLAARYHADMHKAGALDADALLWLLQATDALRRPGRFMQLLDVCELDVSGAKGDSLKAMGANDVPARERLAAALTAARGSRCGRGREARARPGKNQGRSRKGPSRRNSARDRRQQTGAQESRQERPQMMDLYTWTTPNGRKVSIMLEERGLPYRVHAINIGQGDQFTPEFVAISPNSKIPAIVDPDGPDGKPYAMMESGAILVYLGGKDRQVAAEIRPAQVRCTAMADVPDGRRRPDVRAGSSFPARGQGAGAVRDRALHQGKGPPVRRAGQATGRARVPRRRIFDRRHCDLSVGCALRMAQDRIWPTFPT